LSNVFLARHLFVTLNGLTSYSFAAVRLDPLFGAMQNDWHTSDENPAMAIRCKAGKIDDDESGQRESNPHGQLGRLELYH
jgi:hypothetical protein